MSKDQFQNRDDTENEEIIRKISQKEEEIKAFKSLLSKLEEQSKHKDKK